MKINKKGLKSSVITCFFVILFNFVFSILAFLLVWYWAIPNICMIVPNFKVYFESLDEELLPIAYNIIYSIGACIAIFPSTLLAYRVSRKRQKEFLDYSKGCISYSDGLKYHFMQYGLLDGICILSVTVLLAVIYMAAGDIFIVRVFPIAFNMFSNLGTIFGILVTAVLTGLSMIFGAFFAQKKWRAQYFVVE